MNSKTKPTIFRSAIGAGLLFCTIGLANAQTSNSVITFSVDLSAQVTGGTFVPGTDTVAVRGTFNSFGQFFLTNNPADPVHSNVYSGTLLDTTDVNGAVMTFKYWNSDAATPNGGWESPANGGNNRAAHVPSNSGGALVLPTVYFSDAGAAVTNTIKFQVDMAQQINLGLFVAGTDAINARGDFNGFGTASVLTNDPSILRTNQFGLVSSNVYVGYFDVVASPNAEQSFKFWNSDGSAPNTGWENPGPANANPARDGNRFFVNAAQTLPVVFYSDAPYAPIATNLVTFQVDMSALSGGVFDPSQDTVDLRGSFNNWGNAPQSPTICTNDPNAANTNIYSAKVTIIDGVGATEQYKFTYNGANVPGGTYWENPAPPTLGGNRFFTQPNATSTTLPPVYFSDVLPNSVLPENTAVTFNINMTGAHETGGTPFDPASCSVYINGDFLGWVTWDTLNLAPYQLTENPVGSTNYTITLTVKKGNPLALTYKFGIYDGSSTSSLDNEALSGQNHFRYIRQAPAYTMPTDIFGNQFGEPVAWGNLQVGKPNAGHVPVSWLGLPGVHLQTGTNVVGSTWVDLNNTDGTNWTAGVTSNNGFVSITNYPTTGGKTFFRLIKPGH